VKFYHRGKLVKVHPRQPAGGRSTDRVDLPEHKAGYALRDLAALIATCAAHGPNIGIYAETHPRRSAALDPDAHRLPATRPGASLRRLTASSRHAHSRWILMSSRSTRSRPCSNAPPRTPPRLTTASSRTQAHPVHPRPIRINTTTPSLTVVTDEPTARRSADMTPIVHLPNPSALT